MIHTHDPDQYVTEVGPNYVTHRKATPEEYDKNRRKRLQARKKQLEEELARIKLELGEWA